VTQDQDRRVTTLGSSDSSKVSRRSFLGGALGVTSLAAFGAAGVAGCGSSSSASGTASAAGKPRRGGSLRIASTGGTTSDTLNANTEVNNTDLVRAPLLYDSLVTLDQQGHPALWLAEEITPNSDATAWTVRVRPGVVFHDGKPLTADDVLYTFTQMLKQHWNGSVNYTSLDIASSKVLDSSTVRFACNSPFSTFVEELAGVNGSAILPVGFNPQRPIGTGPFRYHSFTPGVGSVFLRNDNYWQHGLPYLDSVSVLDFQDDTSQVNALEANNVDAIAYLDAASVAEVKSAGYETITSPGGAWNPITMLVDQAPFNDVRVRQAFRLLVDRESLREAVFAGYGALGNDLFATWDPEYNTELPQRTQDLDQAKFLLKQAGAENLTTTLVTSNLAAGVTQTATVFAQQASAAGVTVNLSTLTPTTFFGPDYLHRLFSQDVWSYLPYWPTVAQSSLPWSDYNDTHFTNATYAKLYDEALRTLNPQLRKELAWEMQKIEYNEGGYIVPVLVPNLMAYAPRVHNLAASKSGYPFNGSDLLNVWVD
jgi:peptide/nickel transport system substrate-binding protein